jgi:ribose transport system substrate-binding protein
MNDTHIEYETGKTGSPRLRRPAIALVTVGVLLGVAACGSSSSGSPAGSGATTSSDQIAAAGTRAKAELAVPTSIPETDPLSATPPTGKTVYLITAGNLPGTVAQIPSFKEAVTALGWTPKVVTYDSGNLQQNNSAVQQAVDSNADYIMVVTDDPNKSGSAAAEARKKKIPIVSWSVPVDPAPDTNGIYAAIGGVPWQIQTMTQMGDWAINDSKGTANLLFVNYPDAPSLVPTEAGFKANFAKNCSGCTYRVLNVSAADLGGAKVPSLIVSELQKHPDITYVEGPFGNVLDGVPAAVKAAGMTKVQFLTAFPSKSSIADLQSGAISAVLNSNSQVIMWQALDTFARLSVGAEVEKEQDPITQLWTKTTVPSPVPADGFVNTPTDFQSQYKALWKVG